MGSIIQFKVIQCGRDNATRKTAASHWLFCYNATDSSSTSKEDVGSFEVWDDEDVAKARAREWEMHYLNAGDEPDSPTGAPHFVCLIKEAHRSSFYHFTIHYKDIVAAAAAGAASSPADPLVGEQVIMTVPVLQSDGSNVNASVKLHISQGTDTGEYRLQGAHDGHSVDIQVAKALVRRIAARAALAGHSDTHTPPKNYPVVVTGLAMDDLTILLKALPQSAALASDVVDGFELAEVLRHAEPRAASVVLTRPGAIVDIAPMDEMIEQAKAISSALQAMATQARARAWASAPKELGLQIAAFKAMAPGSSGMVRVDSLRKKAASTSVWGRLDDGVEEESVAL